MGLLDAFDQFSNAKCAELTKQNSTFEKITATLGMSNLVNGVQDFFEGSLVDKLLDSPLRELGEDVLAQAIQNNARRLSQNIMNQVSENFTKTLTDIRSTAFSAVFSTMTFKNDMVLYFASTVAQQCNEAIKEKRRTLISLQESVRQLHNALLVLAGGGPFFNEYLENLKTALIKIDLSEQEVFKVQSAFYSSGAFPLGSYRAAKHHLEEAYNLIMPPITGEGHEELNEGFLENVFEAPEYELQLSMLLNIPKLTGDMLEQYDLYAVKVLKVNVLLLGFQTIVQNLKEVTGGFAKDLVYKQLGYSRTFLDDIIADMSLQLHGDKDALKSTKSTGISITGVSSSVTNTFKPNPTKTSAKAVSWGVRVKSAQVMLEMLDPDALQTLDISNTALRAYFKTLDDIAKLDDRVSSTAILRATDGREQPGDIEADFITFAFQANQAILDTALLKGEPGGFQSNTVISLGAKVNSRLQLSIDQDRDIEDALLRYIKTTAPLIKNIQALGDSIFNMLDGLGMDRASDALKGGDFGKFFSMDGNTSTYVGAAIAGLSAVQLLLSDNAQRECIQGSINKLKVAETSQKLVSQRKVQQNFVKLQQVNEKKCAEVRRAKKKVDGCASGIDLASLKDNPMKSLGSLFSGVFGGETFDSLGGSTGGFADAAFSSSNKGIANLGFAEGKGSTIFSNVKASAIAAQDATKNAVAKVESAKAEMTSAINEVEGFKAEVTESVEALSKKVEAAKKVASGDLTALEDAGVSKEIADVAQKEATDLLKNVDNVKDVFKDKVNSVEIVQDAKDSLGGSDAVKDLFGKLGAV